MVSSVLAQAILNQQSPDILGAFERGREKVRKQKTDKLVGEAISTGKIDPSLAELDPQIAFALGEQLRARNAKDISDFLRDSKIAKAKLEAGDVQGAIAFGQQRRNAIKMRGGDTSQTDQFISLVQQDPQMALESINGLLGSIEQTKPAEIAKMEFLTQGLSDDEKIKARRIALGLDPRASSSLQERIASDPDLATDVAETQAMIESRKAGAKEGAKLAVQGEMRPEIERAVTTAKEEAKRVIQDKSVARSDQKALNVYESAVAGLLADFETAETGAFVGLLPAITADERVLEASINIMRPVIKSVVREAGEGTFTDSDQKLIDEMMPTRRDSMDVARRKIERLDSFVRSKLSGAAPSDPASKASPQSGGIKFLGFE